MALRSVNWCVDSILWNPTVFKLKRLNKETRFFCSSVRLVSHRNSKWNRIRNTVQSIDCNLCFFFHFDIWRCNRFKMHFFFSMNLWQIEWNRINFVEEKKKKRCSIAVKIENPGDWKIDVIYLLCTTRTLFHCQKKSHVLVYNNFICGKHEIV